MRRHSSYTILTSRQISHIYAVFGVPGASVFLLSSALFWPGCSTVAVNSLAFDHVARLQYEHLVATLAVGAVGLEPTLLFRTRILSPRTHIRARPTMSWYVAWYAENPALVERGIFLCPTLF
jgi:hypothetical protein